MLESGETKWQKMLAESDFNKRKMACFEMLEAIGIDTSDWIERIKAEKEIDG